MAYDRLDGLESPYNSKPALLLVEETPMASARRGLNVGPHGFISMAAHQGTGGAITGLGGTNAVMNPTGVNGLGNGASRGVPFMERVLSEEPTRHVGKMRGQAMPNATSTRGAVVTALQRSHTPMGLGSHGNQYRGFRGTNIITPTKGSPTKISGPRPVTPPDLSGNKLGGQTQVSTAVSLSHQYSSSRVKVTPERKASIPRLVPRSASAMQP